MDLALKDNNLAVLKVLSKWGLLSRAADEGVNAELRGGGGETSSDEQKKQVNLSLFLLVL
jgi:hypothetical protein